MTRRLSVRLPVALVQAFVKAAQDARRIRLSANRHGEFTLIAGTGGDAVIIDRTDWIRVQLGIGKGATSHWLGRTAAGNLIPNGGGTFVGRSGASQRGATLLDGRTLQADPEAIFDGKTKRWWAKRGKPVFDESRVKRTFARSAQATIGQIASTLRQGDALGPQTLFQGVKSVSKKARIAAGRPSYSPRTIKAREEASAAHDEYWKAINQLAAFDSTLRNPSPPPSGKTIVTWGYRGDSSPDTFWKETPFQPTTPMQGHPKYDDKR